MENEKIDVDAVIVSELVEAIRRELELPLLRDEGGAFMTPDWELVDALQRVCEYYTPFPDIAELNETINALKLKTQVAVARTSANNAHIKTLT